MQTRESPAPASAPTATAVRRRPAAGRCAPSATASTGAMPLVIPHPTSPSDVIAVTARNGLTRTRCPMPSRIAGHSRAWETTPSALAGSASTSGTPSSAIAACSATAVSGPANVSAPASAGPATFATL